MVITSYGEGGFKIQTSNVILAIQPPGGGRSVRLKADVFIRTAPQPIDGEIAEHVIKGAGEYEIKGVEISGFPGFIYAMKAEGVRLGYFGDPAATIEILEKIKSPDVLFIASTAANGKIIRQMNPKIIISAGGDAKELEKEFGLKAEIADKLAVKQKTLADDKALGRLILLKG